MKDIWEAKQGIKVAGIAVLGQELGKSAKELTRIEWGNLCNTSLICKYEYSIPTFSKFFCAYLSH